eukprot:Skav207559  [mRNA]  locus=scaffold3235:159914:163458:- [translate_table: standard]
MSRQWNPRHWLDASSELEHLGNWLEESLELDLAVALAFVLALALAFPAAAAAAVFGTTGLEYANIFAKMGTKAAEPGLKGIQVIVVEFMDKVLQMVDVYLQAALLAELAANKAASDVAMVSCLALCKLEGLLLERLGETLLVRSTAPDFGARELYNALLDTCKAIRVINMKLIARQDITAKNIAKGRGVATYKVFDLDAAIQLESSEQLTRQWPGTFHAMSPEARSSAYSPIANDAWAIGATFGEQASALARKNWEELDMLEDAPDLANCVMACKKLLQPAEQRPRMDSAPASFNQLLATISVGSPAHFTKTLVNKMDSELC